MRLIQNALKTRELHRFPRPIREGRTPAQPNTEGTRFSATENDARHTRGDTLQGDRTIYAETQLAAALPCTCPAPLTISRAVFIVL